MLFHFAHSDYHARRALRCNRASLQETVSDNACTLAGLELETRPDTLANGAARAPRGEWWLLGGAFPPLTPCVAAGRGGCV
eukprot:8024103-Pyramimonas_sp.AAC.1